LTIFVQIKRRKDEIERNYVGMSDDCIRSIGVCGEGL
jgi:hypothetical protein